MTISATTQGLKPGVCTSSNRPANPFDGQVIYMTDVDQTAVWDGTQWTVLAPIAGGRNRIINGNAAVWQRGTSFTNPGTGGTYTADRWNTYFNGTGTVTQETTTVPAGSKFAIKLTSTSTNGGIAAYQLIEDVNVYPLQGKTVVLSLQVAGTTAPNIGLAYSTTANDTLTNTSTLLTATTIASPTISTSLQTYSFSFSVPSTAKTLRVGVGTGSVVNGNYIIFGNVQLEAGAVATPFEFEDIGTTLEKCQRYYEKTYNIGTNPGTATQIGMVGNDITASANHSNYIIARFPYKVTKRSAPTITTYDASGNVGKAMAFNVGAAGTDNFTVTADFVGENSFRAYLLGISSAGFTIHYTANAEL